MGVSPVSWMRSHPNTVGHTDQRHATHSCDPDAVSALAGWGPPPGGSPTSPQLSPASVTAVTGDDTTPQFDESMIAEAEAAMRDARARLGDIPAEVVISNHVMGLYELAAIHLSAEPPALAEAALAIDAVGCLVEGLGARLGADHEVLSEALTNIRMAFVQIKGAQ